MELYFINVNYIEFFMTPITKYSIIVILIHIIYFIGNNGKEKEPDGRCWVLSSASILPKSKPIQK